MTTELTAVSTFGWYLQTPTTDELTPVSTFGWYLGIVVLGDPDLITFALFLTQIKELELEL